MFRASAATWFHKDFSDRQPAHDLEMANPNHPKSFIAQVLPHCAAMLTTQCWQSDYIASHALLLESEGETSLDFMAYLEATKALYQELKWLSLVPAEETRPIKT